MPATHPLPQIIARKDGQLTTVIRIEDERWSVQCADIIWGVTQGHLYAVNTFTGDVGRILRPTTKELKWLLLEFIGADSLYYPAFVEPLLGRLGVRIVP